jgi:hypothetical protein
MLTCIQRENTTLTDCWISFKLCLWEWGAVQCYSSFTESLANHIIYRKEHTGQDYANPAHQPESCTWRLDLQDIEPSPTKSPYPLSSLVSRNRPHFPKPRGGPCNTVPHVHYSRSSVEYLLPLCRFSGWRFRTMSNLRHMCLCIS